MHSVCALCLVPLYLIRFFQYYLWNYIVLFNNYCNWVVFGINYYILSLAFP
jgi:hypothetical protein